MSISHSTADLKSVRYLIAATAGMGIRSRICNHVHLMDDVQFDAEVAIYVNECDGDCDWLQEWGIICRLMSEIAG